MPVVDPETREGGTGSLRRSGWTGSAGASAAGTAGHGRKQASCVAVLCILAMPRSMGHVALF